MLLLLCTLEEGDKDLVEQLFIKYKKPLYFYLYKILKNDQFTEDALQVVFFNIITNIDKIKELYPLRRKNYIYKMAKNTAMNFYNKNKFEESITKPYDEDIINDIDEKHSSAVIAQQSMSEALEKCIQLLKDSDKDIISLKYGFDWSDTEIAAHLNISEDAVRKRISRAKIRLAALIEAN